MRNIVLVLSFLALESTGLCGSSSLDGTYVASTTPGCAFKQLTVTTQSSGAQISSVTVTQTDFLGASLDLLFDGVNQGERCATQSTERDCQTAVLRGAELDTLNRNFEWNGRAWNEVLDVRRAFQWSAQGVLPRTWTRTEAGEFDTTDCLYVRARP